MNTKFSKTHQHSGADVARALGVYPSTVLRWAQNLPGFPQPIRVSTRTVLYDLNAVRAFLEERSKKLGGA